MPVAMSWVRSVVCMSTEPQPEDDMTPRTVTSSITTSNDDSEREIRDLHDAWFAASHAKDLDASMAPIAADVVSYEHTAPLECALDEMRAECARGFAAASDDFMWTVPDLRVAVDGDLAVAWGLNRMAEHQPGGTERVTWSRGTRVFARRDGAWRMVHQHVSFPLDPASGLAAINLCP
jgi:ketosteroid isomerase-like protein